jgi:ABC-type methionine transport system ATPase subunit
MSPRFHLTLPGHLAEEPVIYRLGREFDVVTNIRRANIDDRLSWMILEITGAADDIGRAVAWLEQRGIQVDRIDGEA